MDRERSAGGPGLSTPRAMLPKGGPEWCRRTADRLVWAQEKRRIVEAEFNKILAELDQHEAWKVIPEGEPYGSREAMLYAILGGLP